MNEFRIHKEACGGLCGDIFWLGEGLGAGWAEGCLVHVVEYELWRGSALRVISGLGLYCIWT